MSSKMSTRVGFDGVISHLHIFSQAEACIRITQRNAKTEIAAPTTRVFNSVGSEWGPRELPFLKCSQVILMLLIHSPHFEQQETQNIGYVYAFGNACCLLYRMQDSLRKWMYLSLYLNIYVKSIHLCEHFFNII